MADNMNCESNEKELDETVNERIAKEMEDATFSNRDKLAIIIAAYFDSTPEREAVGAEPASLASVREWFYEHCQSGKLLELKPEDAIRVRNCYAAIKDNHLLGEFWQEFKDYRDSVKARLAEQRKRKAKPCQTDVQHPSPLSWNYLGISVAVNPTDRSITITDKAQASSYNTLQFRLDYSWNLPSNSSLSRLELQRIIVALKRKGLIAEINKAIAEQY